MDSGEQLAGRAIFEEEMAAPLIPRVVQMLEEAWPDLASLHGHALDKDGASNAITIRKGVEVRLSQPPDGGVRLGIEVFPEGTFMSVAGFSELVQKLGTQWNWSSEGNDGLPCLRLTRVIRGEDLSPTREVALRGQIAQAKLWVDSVRPPGTSLHDQEALMAKYRKFEEMLKPVLPWETKGGDQDVLGDWAAGVADLLLGGVAAGIAAPTTLEQSMALSVLASALGRCGDVTLGRVLKPSLNSEQVLLLAAKAPGIVAAPARILRIGSNRYELSNDATNILSSLAADSRAVVFVGTYGELQGVFHGGQGVENDPLQPVVCHFPEAAMETLIEYAVLESCQQASIGSVPFKSDVRREIAECLESVPTDVARRLVRQTASRSIEKRLRPGVPGDALSFAHRLAACSETLGGISKHPRVRRSAGVQQRYLQGLTDPGLGAYLKKHLLGQDAAIDEQVEKLRRQVLTCPLHQPLRVGALGPTGTGKSESAALLARWLDVPFVNIDAASMPDAHTAMSQMLGSGRGIVDSDQAGRLEQVAKHHEGVVVELSDIDHAVPSVRTAITDLALQLLQTGEAQAAKGHMFSCANLLLVFTLNLPDGKDERVFQPMGFGQSPTLDEVRKDVRRELKRMFSTAFWGRVGDPVLFGPLEQEVRVEIVRRCLEEAAVTAMERLRACRVQVEVSTEVAARLLSGPGAPASHHGARGLLELARQHAARAVMTLAGDTASRGQRVFELTVDIDGGAALQGKE